MLATDAKLDIRAGLPPPICAHFYQLANPFNINRHKRICMINPLLFIGMHEIRRIITADAQRGLGKIIGSKREKLGCLAQLIRTDCGARQLHHCTDQIVDFLPAFVKHLSGDIIDNLPANLNLLGSTGQRYHDFRNRGRPGGSNLYCSFEDGPCLHRANFRIGDRQPAPAMPQHRVGFLQAQGALPCQIHRHPDSLCHLCQFCIAMRQEFMQRRVQQTNGYRQARHDSKQLGKVLFLHWQQLIQRLFAPGLFYRHDHLAHGHNTIFVKEHMFGAA